LRAEMWIAEKDGKRGSFFAGWQVCPTALLINGRAGSQEGLEGPLAAAPAAAA